MKLVLIGVLLSYTLTLIQGLNILGVFSYCAHSHFTYGFRLMKELADRGHNVTMITCYPLKDVKNIRQVSVEDMQKPIADINIDLVEWGQQSYWAQLETLAYLGKFYTGYVLRAKSVQELLNSDQEFDIVVMEHFVNDALTIFQHRFQCPLVILSPGPPTLFNNHLVGNPAPPSYVKNILADYDSKMNFWERLQNTYRYLVGELFVHFRHVPQQSQLLKEVFPDAPDLQKILYNVSLMFITSHVSLGDAIPLQQNVIEIGGFHVSSPKPLPKDIKEFMDNATEGVVLFSMGSNLKSSHFDSAKTKAILKAFSKIKQKVIWKFEIDVVEKPDNVMTMSWLPQQDILAHPNTIAFISHGGLLGTTESVHHGVPILGLPVFWDQIKNIEEATRNGYAVRLNFKDLNEELFDKALNELLNNPMYRRTAKESSYIMRDQPVKQMDAAVYWVEYVVRHKGAAHLQSAAVHLRWYQLYLVDIVFVVALVITVLLLALNCIVKLLFCKKGVIEEKKKRN